MVVIAALAIEYADLDDPRAMAEATRLTDLLQVTRERRAEALRADGASRLASVPAWAPEADKLEGWALEDEADALEHDARLRRCKTTPQRTLKRLNAGREQDIGKV